MSATGLRALRREARERWAWALAVVAAVASGCSCALEHAPDAGDIGVEDGGLRDASEGPVDSGADDGGRVCPVVAEIPPPCGNCDSLGRDYCRMWAEQEIGSLPPRDGGWIAFAECQAAPVCCVRASAPYWQDAGGSLDVSCGAEPPCGPYEVCVSRFEGDPPSCRCIADAP